MIRRRRTLACIAVHGAGDRRSIACAGRVRRLALSAHARHPADPRPYIVRGARGWRFRRGGARRRRELPTLAADVQRRVRRHWDERLDIDGVPYTVIGVAPPAFRGLSGEATLWMPIASMPGAWGAADPSESQLLCRGAIGAWRASADARQSVVSAIGQRIDATYPDAGPASPLAQRCARSTHACRWTYSTDALHPLRRRWARAR